MSSILLLLCFCGAALSSVIQKHIEYHSLPKSWQDAKMQCQIEGMELVTFVAQSDIDSAHIDSYSAWIGLKLYSNNWNWFDGSNMYNADNGNFAQDEPGADDDCALAKYTYTGAVGDDCEDRNFFFCHYHDGTRKYRFYDSTKSWDEAFQYCQSTGQYLAIFNSWGGYLPSADMRDFPVWTGLYEDGESWMWSDGTYSDYRKWTDGFEPDLSSGPGLCVSVQSLNKSMSVHNCSEAYPFLCYSHNLVLVKQNLTWENALEQCRSLETVSPYVPHRLLSLEQSELLYVNSIAVDAQTDKVWLGLRFLGGSWFWSNGETVSLSGLPSCPEPRLSCGALVLDRTTNGSAPQPNLELCDCSERFNLLCYKF